MRTDSYSTFGIGESRTQLHWANRAPRVGTAPVSCCAHGDHRNAKGIFLSQH